MTGNGPRPASSIPAYDCYHQEVTIMDIDLHEPMDCPDPTRDYEPVKGQQVQVIRTENHVRVKALRCKVTVSREAAYCWVTSIRYGSRWSEWKKDVRIAGEDCERALHGKEIWIKPPELGGRTIPLKKGGRHQDRWFSKGMVHDNGACEVDEFWRNGRHYPYHYEQSMVDVVVEELYGSWDATTGRITFRDQLQAHVGDGMLHDLIEGTVVWELPQYGCREFNRQVYYGKAEVYARVGSMGPERFHGAVVVISNETDKLGKGAGQDVMGFMLRESIQLCEADCLATQTEGITVCLQLSTTAPIPELRVGGTNQTEDLWIGSLSTRLTYWDFDQATRVSQRFRATQYHLCRIGRKTLFNKLQLISGNDNPYALIDLFGRGHTVYVTGSAARVVKCVPIEVQHAVYRNCTEEMPVHYGMELRFLDPISWVAKMDPTVIPCSGAMATRWRVAGAWYCPEVLAPGHVGVRQCYAGETEQIQAPDWVDGPGSATKGQPKGMAATSGKTGGGRELRRQIDARNAVMRSLANTAISNVKAGRLGSVRSDHEINLIADGVGRKITPWYEIMGSYSIVIVVLIAVAGILQCAARTSTHLVLISHQMGGCGCWTPIAMCEGLLGLRLVAYQGLKDTSPQSFIAGYLRPILGIGWRRKARGLRARWQSERRSYARQEEAMEEGVASGATRRPTTGGQASVRQGSSTRKWDTREYHRVFRTMSENMAVATHERLLRRLHELGIKGKEIVLWIVAQELRHLTIEELKQELVVWHLLQDRKTVDQIHEELSRRGTRVDLMDVEAGVVSLDDGPCREDRQGGQVQEPITGERDHPEHVRRRALLPVTGLVAVISQRVDTRVATSLGKITADTTQEYEHGRGPCPQGDV